MTRSLLILPLLAACAELPPDAQDDPAPLGKGDDGDPLDEPAIVLACLDDDCSTARATLVPEPDVEVAWFVDGEPWSDPEGGPKLDLRAPGRWAIDVEVGDELLARAAVQAHPSRDEGGGPQTVVLAFGGTCQSFRVQTVGGCITSTLNVLFQTTGRSDIVFQTQPLPTALVLPGHALAAWWPDGTLPAGVVALSALDGLGYLFALQPSSSTMLSVFHNLGASTERLFVGQAYCDASGSPGIGP